MVLIIMLRGLEAIQVNGKNDYISGTPFYDKQSTCATSEDASYKDMELGSRNT